ncbi:MAG: MFS transporter [Pseudomonadota bacterium]
MILSASRRLRFTTFTLLYVAQGVPIGILDVAMPAWLAAQGYDAAAVGSFVAIVGLPWAFKLVAGPFMDRFGFPPMGRRRPWIMLAQGGLMLMLVLLALVPDPASQLGMLMAVGFLVNACAATQDVAVDGMAIDILPFAERGRANAFMAFGQVGGIAGTGVVAAYLLANFGLVATGLAAALTIGAIFSMVVISLERPGERRLPWSSGLPHPEAEGLSPTLGRLFTDLRRALLLPMSLVITASVFLVRVAMGAFLAATPVFAVQELGFEAEVYSRNYGTLIGVCAVFGLLVGPLVDRFGARQVLLAALVVGATLLASFSLLPGLWGNDRYLFAMLAAYLLVEQVIFVCLIAQYMNLTWQKVAATQFAVYMALANLGRSTGAGLSAALSVELDFASLFLVFAGLYLLSFACLLAFREPRHLRDLESLGEASS